MGEGDEVVVVNGGGTVIVIEHAAGDGCYFEVGDVVAIDGVARDDEPRCGLRVFECRRVGNRRGIGYRGDINTNAAECKRPTSTRAGVTIIGHVNGNLVGTVARRMESP